MRPDLYTLAIGLCGDRGSWSVGVGAVPGGIVVESGGRGGGMVALRPALSFARLQGLHLLSGWDGPGALTYGDFNLLGGRRPIRSEHPHKPGSRSVVEAQGWAALACGSFVSPLLTEVASYMLKTRKAWEGQDMDSSASKEAGPNFQLLGSSSSGSILSLSCYVFPSCELV